MIHVGKSNAVILPLTTKNTYFSISSTASLAGLQVAHKLEDFNDGQERILVLKDSGILDNEEQARLHKNLENKKKKPAYVAYDDEEFLFGVSNSQRSGTGILSHYDEEIEGPKKSSFTLSNDGTAQLNEEERRQQVSENLKSQPISLSFDKMREIKDYYTKEEADMTFKKSKGKKKRRVRKKLVDDEETDSQNLNVQQKMDVDATNSNGVTPTISTPTRARRMANKKLIKTSVDDIARNLTQNREQNNDEGDTAPGELVISDTTEFVNSLTLAPLINKRAEVNLRTSGSVSAVASSSKIIEKQSETINQDEEEDVENLPDEMAEEEKKGGWKAAGIVENQDMAQIQEETKLASVVEEEPLVSSGMAATLALLQQKGFSIKPSDEQLEKERVQRDRQKWLGEQRKKDVERQNEREREKQRAKEKGYRGGGRDNESTYRDREHMREMEARFKDYKPDVNLEYVDEFGNQLTPKEAFRQLSHKFHGKSSGKAKTEKRLKKLEEERKLKAMSSIDTPLNMATALQERQKASGSAHVVLSVGNRAVVPPSMVLNGGKPNAAGSSQAISSPSIITVNGGLTGQSMNAPEREKVTFGLKRKAETDQEKPSKKR
ncbi:1459_t:CDS:10 [Ambispora gerdemannii]|uniref:1459_t:CDS:1 n=1 Tax=Ambispora gerdemannii TaxID=144530 RepID=A0A9N9AIU2_9GLOM|nr:1459_t:CDS:10 [Ambispora gerdemannii]